MANKLDSLIKNKKLTGAEVGRLVLSNTINVYSRALKGEKDPKPLFSQASLDNMVNKIEGSHDIKVYNRYIALGRWIEKETIRTTGFYYSFQSSARGYMLDITASYTAEKYLADVNARPLVMTQEEYDKTINDLLEKYLESEDLTLGELLVDLLIERYKEYKAHSRKKSKYKAIFKSLEETEAPKVLLEHLNMLYKDDDIIEQGQSLLEIFDYDIEGDFFPYAFDLYETEGVEESFIEEEKELLLTYYGELLQVALEEINKELKQDNKLSPDNFPLDVISRREAYKLDFLGYREKAEELSLIDSNIAIKGALIKAHKPLFGDFFEYGLMDLTAKESGLDNLLGNEERQSIIKYLRKELNDAYIYLLAFNTVIGFLAKNLDIPDFESLKISEKETLEQVKAINGVIEIFRDFIAGQSKLTWTDNKDAKLKLFDTCIKPIDIEHLVIPENRITALDSVLSNGLEAFDSKTYPDLDLINELIEGVDYD